MNILATEFSLKHKVFEIYVAGCTRRCEGCHNYESWDFRSGDPWHRVLPGILAKINRHSELIDKVWVLGGEPLDQHLPSLESLLWSVNTLTYRVSEVWLWTSYEIEDVPEYIKSLLTHVKTGRYMIDALVDDHTMYGVTLASSNQKVWRV